MIIINQEIKADTGQLYMTFKLLKRRYRSSETEESLKRLEYFNHPYEQDNTIRLIDDIDLPKSISLYSLANQFISYEEQKKKANFTVDRTDIDRIDEYEHFDANNSNN